MYHKNISVVHLFNTVTYDFCHLRLSLTPRILSLGAYNVIHCVYIRRHPSAGSMLGQTHRRWPSIIPALGRHDTLIQCWFDVGTPSATPSQHLTNIVSTSRVSWYLCVMSCPIQPLAIFTA